MQAATTLTHHEDVVAGETLVNEHVPLQNKRLNGLNRNLSAIPDHVISSELRGRSSNAGHFLKMYCVAKSRSLHWSGVSVSLRALIESISCAQYDSFCQAGSSCSKRL